MNQAEKKAIIVDVTIPYRGELNALYAARDVKITKYSSMAHVFKAKRPTSNGALELPKALLEVTAALLVNIYSVTIPDT